MSVVEKTPVRVLAHYMYTAAGEAVFAKPGPHFNHEFTKKLLQNTSISGKFGKRIGKQKKCCVIMWEKRQK